MIKDGLVLSLDAGDRNSYVSGSLIWNDLSGNGNSGTLVNGPTYSSSYNGSIVQDGSNDYISIPYNTSLAFPGNTSFSFQLAMQNKSFVSDYPTILGFGEQDADGFIGGWMVMYFYNALYSGPYGAIGVTRWRGSSVSAGGDAAYSFTSAIESRTPIIWSYTYDSTYGGKLYKNSTLVQATATTGSSIVPPAGPFMIGRRVGRADRVTNCIIYSLKIHNKALSETEVLQNYNATKTRFGL